MIFVQSDQRWWRNYRRLLHGKFLWGCILRLRDGRLNSGGHLPDFRALGHRLWCGNLRYRDIDWNIVDRLSGESSVYLLWCLNPRLRDADWDSVDRLCGKPPMRLFRWCKRLRNIDLDIVERFDRRLCSGSLKLLLEWDVLIRVVLGRSSDLVDCMKLLARGWLSFW